MEDPWVGPDLVWIVVVVAAAIDVAVVEVVVAVAAIGCYWPRHWDQKLKMTSFGH